ncbi:MAG: DUF4132 domain-containing protein [Gracilibacteraceae bacterium]|nr:DUF4132 domain-containing protein [Gracilibacteraceae bacterium]
MTPEKLLETWDKEILPQLYDGPPTRSTWTRAKAMSAAALAYFRGERATWPRDVNCHILQSYPQFLVDALTGEGREMAVRMLLAWEQLSDCHFVDYTDTDKKALLGMGKTFTELMRWQEGRSKNIFSCRHEQFGTTMAELFPAQAAEYVLEQWPRIARRENPAYISVLFMAGELIRRAPGAHPEWEQGIGELIRLKLAKPGDDCEEFLTLLYRYWEFIPELKAILAAELMRCGRTATWVRGQLRATAEFRELAAKLALPEHFYPMLICAGCDCRDVDAPSYMRDLLRNDPQLYRATYRALLAQPDRQTAAAAFPLLSLLRAAGEGEGEAAELDGSLKFWAKLARQLAGERRHRESIRQLMLLFEHLPAAEALILDLLAQKRRSAPADYYKLLQSFIAGHDPAWCGRSRAESSLLLTEGGGAEASDIFFAWSLNPRIMENGDLLSLIARYPEAAAAFAPELRRRTADFKGEEINMLLNWLPPAGGSGLLPPDPLVELLAHSSKQVQKAAEKILAQREAEARAALEQKRPKLKGSGALAARRLLKQWDSARRFGADFVFASPEAARDFCRADLDAENTAAVAWIPAALFSGVRWADLSGEAEPALLTVLLSEYLLLDEPARLALGDRIAEQLYREDLRAAMRRFWEFWLREGAEAKKKMILLPCAIYGSDSLVLEIKNLIGEWAVHSRGALAAFAVLALALNGGELALVTVDGYREKAPTNQVKNAAREAFTLAAREFGVTADELSDRIVPDFGFDRRGLKTMDYGGERRFQLTLTPDLAIALRDEATGKQLKSLPAPKAGEDADKAAAAKKELTELKKSLKAVTQNQSRRLTAILRNGRTWMTPAWKQLFVENPIMYRFAVGLVWGLYGPDGLEASFRYLDDGTFCDAEENGFLPPEEARLSLAHPAEMGPALTERWATQFADYEIRQPIPQLNARINLPAAEELSGCLVTRYQNTRTTAGRLLGLLNRHDLRRGEVLDAGAYTCMFLDDPWLGYRAAIAFDTMYMGIEPGETVVLGSAAFCRLTEDDGFYWYDGDPVGAVSPRDLPARYVSGVLNILDELLL